MHSRILGFAGKLKSGKDTAAGYTEKWIKHYQPDAVIYKIAFADALKKLCIDFLGLTHDDVYTQEGKMRYNATWKMTNREILQKIGTEAMRTGFCFDVWVKLTQMAIDKVLIANPRLWIFITDVRFENEANMIHSMVGNVVHIKRPLPPTKNVFKLLWRFVKSFNCFQHASERTLSDKHIDFTLNNDDTLEWLELQIYEKLVPSLLSRNSIWTPNGLASEEELIEIQRKNFYHQDSLVDDDAHKVATERLRNELHGVIGETHSEQTWKATDILDPESGEIIGCLQSGIVFHNDYVQKLAKEIAEKLKLNKTVSPKPS